MFEIALCDDDNSFLSGFQALLSGVLDERAVEYRLSPFSSPEKLMKSLVDGRHFDLLFLDVLFDTERGIQFAKMLNERKWNIDVVFVTSNPDYAVEGYTAFPLSFLLKPIARDRLAAVIDRFLGKHMPQRLRLTTARGVIQLPVSQILYFEIFGHDVILHKTDGTEENWSGTLKELESALPPRSFVRPHRSYLVNLEHVTGIVRYRMALSSGASLPISKALYRQIQCSLVEYDDRQSLSF